MFRDLEQALAVVVELGDLATVLPVSTIHLATTAATKSRLRHDLELLTEARPDTSLVHGVEKEVEEPLHHTCIVLSFDKLSVLPHQVVVVLVLPLPLTLEFAHFLFKDINSLLLRLHKHPKSVHFSWVDSSELILNEHVVLVDFITILLEHLVIHRVHLEVLGCDGKWALLSCLSDSLTLLQLVLCLDRLKHSLLLLSLGGLALDVDHVALLALSEVGLTEHFLVGDGAGLLESIHIELSDEAREVTVLEVLRQDLLTELLHVFHNEARAVLVPCYNVVLRLITNEVVGFGQEKRHIGWQSLIRVYILYFLAHHVKKASFDAHHLFRLVVVSRRLEVVYLVLWRHLQHIV